MDREFLEKRKKDLNAYLQVSCYVFCLILFSFPNVESLPVVFVDALWKEQNNTLWVSQQKLSATFNFE